MRGIERSEMASLVHHVSLSYRDGIATGEAITILQSYRRSTEPSRSARYPSSGPIGRSKNARLSTGYVATFPRKGGRVPLALVDLRCQETPMTQFANSRTGGQILV